MNRLIVAFVTLVACNTMISYAADNLVVQPPLTNKYPYLIVSPAAPTTVTGNISATAILGTASNSCFAPSISNVSFKITESTPIVSPPLYLVNVRYTVVQQNHACIDLYDPVEYGPVFELGRLAAGTYRVLSANSPALIGPLGEFTVRDASLETPKFEISGMVHDDPSPLERASMPVAKVKLVLYDNSPTPYNEIPPVSSGRVYVSAAESTFTDAQGTFRFTPHPAGYFEIVASHPDFKTRVYLLDVTKDTSVSVIMLPSIPVSADETSSVRYLSARKIQLHGRSLTLSLDKRQQVTISVFSLDGTRPSSMMLKRLLYGGTHEIDLSSLLPVNGYRVLEIKGEHFVQRTGAVVFTR